MPINTEELCNALQIFAEKEEMKVCVSESFKAAAITGAITFASALVFGVSGIIFGNHFATSYNQAINQLSITFIAYIGQILLFGEMLKSPPPPPPPPNRKIILRIPSSVQSQ